jgi:hypothetical protein
MSVGEKTTGVRAAPVPGLEPVGPAPTAGLVALVAPLVVEVEQAAASVVKEAAWPAGTEAPWWPDVALESPCEVHHRLQVLGFPKFDINVDVLGEDPTNRLAFWWGDSWGCGTPVCRSTPGERAAAPARRGGCYVSVDRNVGCTVR